MYQYVLFDLDGTLTDPKVGITKGVQYALKYLGIEENNLDKLEPFIGPPLTDSFHEFYGMNEEDCQTAVVKYREYYSKTGVKENEIYPGMKEMLSNLKEKGIVLLTASSKPEDYVHIILNHFDIEQYFDMVVGSTKDGSRSTKIEVMEEAFRRLREHAKRCGKQVDLKSVLMVGDRKFDIEGANHFEIDSAAVTYGYAPEGELIASNPTYLADSVLQLEEVILQMPSYFKEKNIPSFLKTLKVLYPLALYWVWELLIFNLGYFILWKTMGITESMKPHISVYLNAVAAVSTWPMLTYLYHKSHPGFTSAVVKKSYRKQTFMNSGQIVALAVCLAMGLNLLVTYMRLSSLSPTYETVASTQYSVPLSIGLVVYGILTPITEELIFRGVLYNRIKTYFPVPIAIFLGALVFGCYHGNLVQILYAFCMGLAIQFVYELYGDLLAPILFHCSANFIVYLFSKTFGDQLANGSILYGIGFTAVAAIMLVYMLMQYKKKKERYFR